MHTFSSCLSHTQTQENFLYISQVYISKHLMYIYIHGYRIFFWLPSILEDNGTRLNGCSRFSDLGESCRDLRMLSPQNPQLGFTEGNRFCIDLAFRNCQNKIKSYHPAPLRDLSPRLIAKQDERD